MRGGMKHHSEALIYVKRDRSTGSPQTLFERIFRKNAVVLISLALKLYEEVKSREGSGRLFRARRDEYVRFAQKAGCRVHNLTTVLYRLVAIGLLDRVSGGYRTSKNFERRLREMVVVAEDMRTRRILKGDE